MPLPPACPPAFPARFKAFSQIGATGDGGVDRVEGTPANGAARRQVVDWMTALGFETRIDGIGNIFGILDLAGPDAPVIMSGSHIDSQPLGGCFDGAYGVIAAIDAAAAARDRLAAAGTKAVANLAVVAWSGEEGARFRPFMGSKVYAGITDLETELDRPDSQGVTPRQALGSIGFLGTDTPPPPPAAYVELHVECGDRLYEDGGRLGIFDRWWGAHKVDVQFLGATSHTGPTPMARRKDALYAAAQVITDVRALADAAAVGDLHTSVAKLLVLPNSPNVVPNSATAFVELRSVRSDIITASHQSLVASIDKAAQAAGVGYEIMRDDLRAPGTFDPALGKMAHRLAVEMGVEPMHVDTLPGHDAIMISSLCPTLMLTVPSRDGLCHHPDEWTDAQDLELGAAWLTSVLETLARDGS